MSKPDALRAVPRHIAIVMDGNGRWAKKRLMPRFVGHKAGVEAVMRIMQACADRGVEHLTVFAFSSENWKRPADEVSSLMGLVITAMGRYLDRVHEMGVRVRVVGNRHVLSDQLREAWERAEAMTAGNDRLQLNVAFNYGGRWDILQAAQRALAEGLSPADLSEERLASYLALAHAPDPDLFIRTGGELRISNFLLWQSAYTEFVFTDCLWPDFDETELDAAIAAFARRDRRFGGVKPAEPAAAAC